jgi:hypothetical protein
MKRVVHACECKRLLYPQLWIEVEQCEYIMAVLNFQPAFSRETLPGNPYDANTDQGWNHLDGETYYYYYYSIYLLVFGFKPETCYVHLIPGSLDIRWNMAYAHTVQKTEKSSWIYSGGSCCILLYSEIFLKIIF